jgi:prepilin-type N-terminal cleavage/methylation domain-containing protein
VTEVKRLLKKQEKGFTLVELLVVIVILGILSAIVISRFSGASKDAKEANLKANLNSLRSQLEIFKARAADGQYPPTLAILAAQGYVLKVPTDPFYKKNTETTVLTNQTGNGTTAGGWVYDSTGGLININIRSNDPAGPPIDTSWGTCYSAW